MRKSSLAFLLAFATLFLAGCSVTSHLPEDEQLYTGIKTISYAGEKKEKRSKQDEKTGVITSIGDAVSTISQVLEGNSLPAEEQTDSIRELTELEKKAAKHREKVGAENFERSKDEVEAVLAYPPNNAIFGSSKYSSPFKIGLWIHNGFANSKRRFGKWMRRTFGSEPVLLSFVSPQTRAKVATNTLQNFGYFQGKVKHEIIKQKNPKKAKVAYHVTPGPLYFLDSVAYINFPASIDSLLKTEEKKRLLKRGDAFSVENLTGEQARIEQLLRQNGYYYYSASYTSFRADTLQRPQHVQLQVLPAKDLPEEAKRPWYIGKTFISVRDHATAPLTTQRKFRSYEFTYSGKKVPLYPSVWRHAITHRRGELYTLRHQQRTAQKLSALGVFSQIDVDYVPRDSSATCDTLDLVITAVMDKLYDGSFEVNAKMKSNQHIGPGISFGLAKRNAFRGAETVSFDIMGNYEWQTGAGAGGRSSLMNSFEVGTSLSLEFPRFILPFFKSRRLRFPSSTIFTIDGNWRNRAGFFNMVNLGASVTYKWYKRRRLQHEITLLNLDFDHKLKTTATFDSIMDANPALAMTMRSQFVPSMSYQLTYSQPSRTRHPLWIRASVKEAGNVVAGIYAASGEKWNTLNKELFDNPFSQFAKVTLEVHKSWRLNRRLQIATRFFGGAVYSYGNSLRAPYSEQFYVGGANSVRGFTVRTVGPGSYRSDDSRYAYLDQTGDIKLEANAELRAKIFGDLYGAVFLDAGNVWLFRDDPQRPGGKFTLDNIKDFAVGTGAGLRYDLEFLVLRFDVGVALHAPYETSKKTWYNIPKFGKSLAYHIAIGYPF